MTVCIAARCADGAIFLASDRMVTVDDLTFEQPTPKVYGLTNAISVLYSDNDSTLHAEILQDLTYRVAERANNEPDNWWLVKDVAELYIECVNEAKLKRAERTFLAPLGLNRGTFIERQKTMDATLVDQLARDMIGYELPAMAVIIAGIDPIAPHIYVVTNGELRCHDAVGFAAIGSGARHAETQLNLSNLTWNSPVHQSLLMSYVAKRRAEAAPGVGKATDMFMIGPQLGSTIQIRNDIIKRLAKEYQRMKRAEEKAIERPMKEIEAYVKNLEQTATAQSQTAPQLDGTGETSATKNEEKTG